jgi:hypothetical protein
MHLRFVTHAPRYMLVACALLVASCRGDKEASAFREYAARYLQAQQDYCSTNVLVAAKGLLEFKQWLSASEHAGEPWYNHDLNLLHVNGRLFLACEFLRETNRADVYYQEGVQAYSRYLQSQHLPGRVLSKEEMRKRLARQEKGLDVRWQNSGSGK